MADFVAVLRKTIDGLAENTPVLRAKVYDKARATVAAKLAAINPPPPAAVADRQKQVLEEAIRQVEASYSGTANDPFAELENVFAQPRKVEPAPARPAPSWSAGESSAALPRSASAPRPLPPLPSSEVTTGPEMEAVAPADDDPFGDDQPPAAAEDDDEVPDESRFEEPVRRRSFVPLIAAVAALALVLGGAYAVWLNRDDFMAMLGIGGGQTVASAPPAGDTAPVNTPPATAMKSSDEETQPEETPKFTQRLKSDGSEVDVGPSGGIKSIGEGTSVAAATQKPQPAPPAPSAPPAQTGAVDSAAAGSAPAAADAGAAAAAEAAGTTPQSPAATPPAPTAGAAGPDMAAATPPATADAAAPPAATDAAVPPAAADAAAPPATTDAATPPATTDAATPPATADAATPPATADATPPATTDAAAPPAATGPAPAAAGSEVPVGQKAIFYEERTNVAEGSAEVGNVVWTLVQESPGDGQPPEPAIHGEATIPGKGLQLRVTIRRNVDKTLPASHIIELIFLTPADFDGGGIDKVLRFTLKDTEEDPGSPVLSIQPTKVADGYFLVALNDTKADIETNLMLFKRQKWIDVPVVYSNGRRALITMEKGIPGDKVFDEVIKAWQGATASAG
jgi:hypothetical protein